MTVRLTFGGYMSVGETVWRNLGSNPHFLIHLMTNKQKTTFRKFIEDEFPVAVFNLLDKPATVQTICEFKIAVARVVVESGILMRVLDCLDSGDRKKLAAPPEKLADVLHDIIMQQVESLDVLLKEASAYMASAILDERQILENLHISQNAIVAVMSRRTSIGDILCLDSGGMMRLFKD